MTNNIQHNYLLNSLYLHFFDIQDLLLVSTLPFFLIPGREGAKKTPRRRQQNTPGAPTTAVSLADLGQALDLNKPHELMVHPKFRILSIYMCVFRGLWHIMAYLCMYIRMYACMCIIYIYKYIYI